MAPGCLELLWDGQNQRNGHNDAHVSPARQPVNLGWICLFLNPTQFRQKMLKLKL